MNEYIEREAVLALLKDDREVCADSKEELKYIREDIRSIPAADVRPVVRAIWQYKTTTVPGGKGQTYAKWCCTACKGKAKERTNFCPNCGAEMEES